jgi:hypothetical protein
VCGLPAELSERQAASTTWASDEPSARDRHGSHPRPTSHIHMPATSPGSTGSCPDSNRPAHQRDSTAVAFVPSPATEESTGTRTANPIEQNEGAIQQDTLRLHTRPASRPTGSQWHPIQRSSKLQHTCNHRFSDCHKRSSAQSSSERAHSSHIPGQTTIECSAKTFFAFVGQESSRKTCMMRVRSVVGILPRTFLASSTSFNKVASSALSSAS